MIEKRIMRINYLLPPPLVVFAVFMAGCPMGGGGEFNITTVDSAGYVGSYTSIAMDSGNIYISYYDATNHDLKFAWSTDEGANWTTTTIDAAGDVGRYTSITVDGSNVCISYCDFTNYDLKFAKSTDGGQTW